MIKDFGILITNTSMNNNDIPLKELMKHLTPHEIGEMQDAQEAINDGVKLNGVIDPFSKRRIEGILAVAEIRFLDSHEERL
jgi:hypothetical protein